MPDVGAQQRASQKFIVFSQFKKMNTRLSRFSLPEDEAAWMENLQPVGDNNLVPVPAANPPLTFLTVASTVSPVPKFVNAGVAAFSQSALSVAPALPASRVHNNLLVAYCRDFSANGNTIAVTAGWTIFASVSQGANYAEVYAWALVTGSETVPTFSVAKKDKLVAQVLQYSGTDTVTPIGNVVSSFLQVNGSSITCPQLTTTRINSLNISSMSCNGSFGRIPRPQGFTNDANFNDTDFSPTVHINICHQTTGSIGTKIGPLAVAVTNNNYNAFMIELLSPSSAAAVQTVESMYFANIGSSDYIIIFSASGAGIAYNVQSGVATLFASAGTFNDPDMTVYNSARVLIADPVAGYCTWDTNAFVQFGGISPNIKVTAGGSGYTSAPTVSFSGGSGSGATATSTLAGGAVVSVTLTSAGTGYKAGDTITVSFSGGGGTGAAATAIIWPKIAGTTLAVYSGRVWIANGRVLQYTGTGGYDDNNVANAAGSTTITDQDLVHSITTLRALNNYLYIFGDASIRQIGSITVSGSLTLFTPLVLSSDIGTSFSNTVLSYNRLVLFANRNGVYGIFGASVEKISDDLDGIFGGAATLLGANHSNIDFSVEPQGALQDLRNIHCYVLLVQYIDPIQGSRPILLVFQEKRWFVVSQNNLVSIAPAFLSSTSQWETIGSSGTDLTILLQDPSTAVPTTLITSLSPHQNPVQSKIPIRAGVGALMEGVGESGATVLNMTVDTENGSQLFTLVDGGAITLINNNGIVVTPLINSNGDIVTLYGKGYRLPYTTVGGYGRYLGLTITGLLSSETINMAAIEYQDAALWGSPS